MKKLADWLNTALGKLPNVNIHGNVWVVYIAILLLFATILIYIGTWVWLMFVMETSNLADLREIIVILCGAPFVAAISTLKAGVVDKDGDGVSDSDEEAKNESIH